MHYVFFRSCLVFITNLECWPIFTVFRNIDAWEKVLEEFFMFSRIGMNIVMNAFDLTNAIVLI